MITYGSLFSGIGGFDLGLDRAGMVCRWQVEKDEKCLEVLGRHWPDVPKYGDVRNVGQQNLPTVDLICGGFPCQDVSVAGGRAGLAGGRSGLWFEFSRIIAELKPQWVIIENVPGLLSSNGGRDMGAIVGALADCGYWWAYRVLDAQHWGVPQRRRRVFIVGCLTRGRAQEVLFERESGAWDTPPGRETGPELATDIAATTRGGSGQRGYPIEWEAGLVAFAQNTRNEVRLISGDGKIAGALSSQPGMKQQTFIAFGGNNTQGPISRATACAANGQRLDFESETFVCNAFNGYTGGPDDNDAQANHIVWDGRHFNDTGNVASILQSKKDGGYSLNYQPLVGVRRLTPTECERLQGFPDGWSAGQSDSIRYRQLGNAVAVPVAEWLGRQIIRALNGPAQAETGRHKTHQGKRIPAQRRAAAPTPPGGRHRKEVVQSAECRG